jgi:hypothetical protein
MKDGRKEIEPRMEHRSNTDGFRVHSLCIRGRWPVFCVFGVFRGFSCRLASSVVNKRFQSGLNTIKAQTKRM